MSKEQYNGIHDIVNDQGFEMHYGAISNTSAIWKFLVAKKEMSVAL